jgi:hypothetical protein
MGLFQSKEERESHENGCEKGHFCYACEKDEIEREAGIAAYEKKYGCKLPPGIHAVIYSTGIWNADFDAEDKEKRERRLREYMSVHNLKALPPGMHAVGFIKNGPVRDLYYLNLYYSDRAKYDCILRGLFGNGIDHPPMYMVVYLPL